MKLKLLLLLFFFQLIIIQTHPAYSQGRFLGEINGGKYSNQFFGFELQFPEYWSVQDDEMKRKLTNEGSRFIAGDDENLIQQINNAQVSTLNLLTIFEHPIGTPVAFNPNFICVVENLNLATPKIKTVSEYFEIAKPLMVNGGYSFPKPVYKESIGGKELGVLMGQVNPMGGIEVYQKYYGVLIKDFVVLFIISYSNSDEEAKVNSIIQSLNFFDTSSQIQNNTVTNLNNATDKKAPVIEITYPQVSRGFTVEEAGKEMTVKGRATDESGIYEVTINGTEASLGKNGEFSSRVLLAVGENVLKVKATDTKNNSAVYQFVVKRKAVENTNFDPEKTQDLDIDVAQLANEGKYYALVVAINDYLDAGISDLEGPLSDADKVIQTLTSHYTFQKENVFYLKNANRESMVEALDKMAKIITPKDNLLIFYAGHGYWDEKLNQGFWLPADAKRESRANWLSNSTLRDYLGGISSKHTLLIADACFSGGIFKTRNAFNDAPLAIKKLYELPSRKAMTSGTMTEVPDKSVFVEYIVKRLNDNKEKYLSGEQLFGKIKEAVINNSANQQVPKFGEIREVGDEGGDFIFIRK